MTRYKITLLYDGSNYCGWQLQKSERTVQYFLEKALIKISRCDHRIPVYGAGRTDKGVHAYGQVAHFDLVTQLPYDKLCNGFNGNLPSDCKVLAGEKTAHDFSTVYKKYYLHMIVLRGDHY